MININLCKINWFYFPSLTTSFPSFFSPLIFLRGSGKGNPKLQIRRITKFNLGNLKNSPSPFTLHPFISGRKQNAYKKHEDLPFNPAVLCLASLKC